MNDKVSFVFWTDHAGCSLQNVLEWGSAVPREAPLVGDQVIQVGGDAERSRRVAV